MLEIYVDADGFPVKEKAYRVANRYGLRVWVVANGWLRIPDEPLITRATVTWGLDRADGWTPGGSGRATSSSPRTCRWRTGASSAGRG